MEKIEYLSNLQVGDIVKCAMHGAGYITNGGDVEIVHLDETTIWVDEIMFEEENYTRNSYYAYDRKTGKQCESMFGMFKTLELPDWEAPD